MKRKVLVLVCMLLSIWHTELLAQTAQELLRAAKDAERDNPTKSVEMYKQIIANHSTDVPACAEAYLGMGICLTEQGHRDEAKTAVDKALALCPDNPDLRKLANVVLFRLREGFHQAQQTEVDKQGRAKLSVDMRFKNNTGKEQKVFKFHSDMGSLIEVKDISGKTVPFQMDETERGTDYTIQFAEPVLPGGEVFFRTVWEMEGLVVCKEGVLLYHFGPHSPGPRCLYEHVLSLPAGSDVRLVSPAPALVRDTGAAKTIVWQQELGAGQSVDVRAEFVIPNVDASRLAIPDYFEAIRTQSNVMTVDGAGKAMCCSEEVRRNNAPVPVSSISFSSGTQAKLLRVLDDKNNELGFTATPGESRTRYTANLRSPVPPGQERVFRSFFELEGIVSREGDLWVCSYRHSPGMDTLYSHMLRLPPDAEIVEAVPKADNTAVVDGMKTLSWTRTVSSGEHFNCRVKYRLPAAK